MMHTLIYFGCVLVKMKKKWLFKFAAIIKMYLVVVEENLKDSNFFERNFTFKNDSHPKHTILQEIIESELVNKLKTSLAGPEFNRKFVVSN